MNAPNIPALLDAMTLGEQVSLLAGADFWNTVPIPRLGIPSLKVSDGPNGARGGGSLVGGVTAACFPCAIALAATWNLALVKEIGAALAEETKSKGARVLLAPTVNLHRSTLNGRNFECYSEDPFLSAELAVAYIDGLQGAGVGATIKHFVGNDSEYQRHTISSEIDARTLREIYLIPFEAAVKRARPYAVMTAYNKVNGTYASEQSPLVNSILRGEWGFDGLVMSDWYGTYATAAAVDGGVDLEMPGPARHRGAKLLAAVELGEVARAKIRAGAERVLRLIEMAGGFDYPAAADERADDRPAARALIRRGGAEACVLLKNDGALPLAPHAGMKIAVIGPNAATARIMGGGSAQLNPHYSVSPLDGLRAALPADVTLTHETGCANDRLVPPLAADLAAEFFDGVAFGGAALHKMTASGGALMILGDLPPSLDRNAMSARAVSSFTPRQDGLHAFSLVASGPARLYLDGALVVDAWDWRAGDEYFGSACAEVVATRHLKAGVEHALRIDFRSPENPSGLGLTVLRVGAGPVLGDADMQRAVDLAGSSDVTLIFAGLTGEWDGEGMDRPHLDLPGRQNELIARAAAANPNTIVVLQSGAPLTMSWLGDVRAVLEAWYPGQECGNAIADVLMGSADPGGRLPQTFPVRLEDDPAFLNYPGENGSVRYGEGIFIGYRFYEKRKIAPLFPFGHGLSYTSFRAANLRLSSSNLAPGETLTASIDVTNIGPRAGTTVMQFYISDSLASVARPPQELKGFCKAALKRGETKTLSITLDMRALAFFDTRRHAWVAEAGNFELAAGLSSTDIAATARFTLDRDWIEAIAAAS